MRASCVWREGDVQSVSPLSDLFPQVTDDLIWIPGLMTKGSDWYVVTQDKFRKRRGAEREALRRAGHCVYVLDPAWCTQPFWSKAAHLVKWWPMVLARARLTKSGVYRVPWNHSTKGKFEGL